MEKVSINNNSWTQAIRELWLTRGLKLEPGVQETEMESIESELGFQFPSDMKDLYRVVNGFKEWDMDVSSMISIWPMQRIREAYKAQQNGDFIGFCDWLINSHSIGFFKGREGVYKCYDEFNPISETFMEVIDLINNDSELIV